jgi:hypothetical protein
MSVPGCQFSPAYDCNPKRIFKVQQEPQIKCGEELINPQVLDKHFFKYRPVASKCVDPSSGCNNITYINSDARLVNSAGPSRLQLDKPPLDSTTKLSTLTHDKSLDCYGQNYKSYADVNAGQISYYISKEREDAFYEPLFSKNATSVGTMYKDPMGSMKPQYDRYPNEEYDPIRNTCDVKGEYCLSWLKDSQYHREDILSKQMRKINQQRYLPRWTNTCD